MRPPNTRLSEIGCWQQGQALGVRKCFGPVWSRNGHLGQQLTPGCMNGEFKSDPNTKGFQNRLFTMPHILCLLFLTGAGPLG